MMPVPKVCIITASAVKTGTNRWVDDSSRSPAERPFLPYGAHSSDHCNIPQQMHRIDFLDTPTPCLSDITPPAPGLPLAVNSSTGKQMRKSMPTRTLTPGMNVEAKIQFILYAAYPNHMKPKIIGSSAY